MLILLGLFWFYVQKSGYNSFKELVNSALKNAEFRLFIPSKYTFQNQFSHIKLLNINTSQNSTVKATLISTSNCLSNIT